MTALAVETGRLATSLTQGRMVGVRSACSRALACCACVPQPPPPSFPQASVRDRVVVRVRVGPLALPTHRLRACVPPCPPQLSMSAFEVGAKKLYGLGEDGDADDAVVDWSRLGRAGVGLLRAPPQFDTMYVCSHRLMPPSHASSSRCALSWATRCSV